MPRKLNSRVVLGGDKYCELKKEVSRMASLRNKRIARLEKNELTECPRYRSWYDNGHVKFSVKGKSHQELQREFHRLQNFINAKTSTVRGANAVLKEIARNTGFEYSRVSELKGKASTFFGLASKIQQYYNSIGQSAQALDYQKIWQQINVLVKEGKVDLNNAESIERGLDKYIEKLNGYSQVEQHKEGYLLSDDPNNGEWFDINK